MVENEPETTVPAPTSRLTKPLALVVVVCFSTYTALPSGEPCNMLILIPTKEDRTNTLLLLRITAW